MVIMLNDLLHLTDEEISRAHIHCCINYDGYNPTLGVQEGS
jgi:hypothetical protein